jgi:nitrate/nitrite transport system substrate-binding protein
MKNKPTPLSRRSVLQGAAALAGAGAFPGIVMAQGAALETRAAKLGFIALTDAAPLFVADEKGFFKKHGMTEVEVLKQSSWGRRATTWCSAPGATASTARTSSPRCPT